MTLIPSFENKAALLTGGAGFIGSHTAISLLQNGAKVIIADNLSNSSIKTIARIRNIAGPNLGKNLYFYECDVKNTSSVRKILREHTIDSIVHFAALKAVSESVQFPIKYYNENINSLLSVLRAMQDEQVQNLVFSSSATVYGSKLPPPFFEDMKIEVSSITSPYGQTKYMGEVILRSLADANTDLNITILRYFNPIGAHPSGLIGENPNGVPTNLMPYLTQVAIGRIPYLPIMGTEYPTKDGTSERDYIHVMDVAEGHVRAVSQQLLGPRSGYRIYNLGTGIPVSVTELLNTFEKVVGFKLNVQFTGPRLADVPRTFANVDKARTELDWSATRSIEEACKDSWSWQKQET